MADNELSQKLNRRMNINEGSEESSPVTRVWSPYTEFKEFSVKKIKELQKIFNKYDMDRDKVINFEELKFMMEKLGEPQTHLSLKAMIKEVDEDRDNSISFREFLLIFRKAAAGELEEGSGLYDLYQNFTEIDVDKEGVMGANKFFQSKIDAQFKDKQFENEIKEEIEEKKKQAEEAKERRQAFKQKAQLFNAA